MDNRAMCGIAGIVSRAETRRLGGDVRRMIAVQKHRGPDGEGYYDSPHAALGHCRLAILDLTSGGQQPMTDCERRYWITFNGEIYNYLELADELRRAGHVFRTRSDTEVLLHAFKHWGVDCLSRLRGMFAFAVWDARDQRLFAARDRLGIKPFHYWVRPDSGELAFASELKALLDFLPERRVNTTLANEFLAWNVLDHDPAQTMLADIARLPAGHWLSWSPHEPVQVHRYWSLVVNWGLHSSARERTTLVSEFRELFTNTVALHLRSDVPVGSCLSGGLDSSSIVCAVSAELKARGASQPDWQHTFSACFDDPALDERPFIDAVTDVTGTRNHRVFPSGQDLAHEVDRWLWHQEEPVGGFGVYSQYCVARLAKQAGVKVLLDGQGADEQLLGYRKFIAVYLRQLFQAGCYWRAAREGVAFLSSRQAFVGAPLFEGRRYWSRVVPNSGRLWSHGGAPVRPDGLGLEPPLGGRIFADMTAFSLPVLLRFEDRNTMAFGLESRVPFVDHVLVEWIGRLPADMRLQDGWTKHILRNALSELLPPAVRLRKSKLGYATPDFQWLAGPLKPWLEETLARPSHLSQVVDPKGVAHLLESHRRGTASRSDRALLVRLAIFERWGSLFLEPGSSRSPAELRGAQPSVTAH